MLSQDLVDSLFPADLPEPAHWEDHYPPRRLPPGAEVTRFAPSPTGWLHIGGVFTASVDQDIAHQSGGVYLVRIEDTDQATWPTFIRPGTPSGFSTMSTGVPSARNGMSSTGRIFEMTPLLPWRPASLSPSVILRFWATYTRTSWLTPGGSSSPSSRENTRTRMTLPSSPCGTLRLGSRTSRAFSPKIARSRRPSGVSSVSPF